MDDPLHQYSVHGNLHTEYFNDVHDTLAKQTIEIFGLKEMYSKFIISQERDRERSRSRVGDHKYREN